MKSCGRINTNFKTVKKGIIGKYEKLKTFGMVWVGQDKPFYVNFDLIKCENEYKEKLMQKWKLDRKLKVQTDLFEFKTEPKNNEDNNNNQIVEKVDLLKDHEKIQITDDQQRNESTYSNLLNVNSMSQILKDNLWPIEQLYSKSDEISKKIAFLVANSKHFVNNIGDLDCTQNKSITEQINELKEQRRKIWDHIEEEESKTNLLVNIEKKKSLDLKANITVTSNDSLQKTQNSQEKYNIINNIANDENANDQYDLYLSNCSIYSMHNDLGNNSIKQKVEFDEQKYKMITEQMKNIIRFNEEKCSACDPYLSSNDMIVISKIIDQTNNNFVLQEHNINFISSDLYYLIPGMINKGFTVIIFINENDDENFNSFIIESIDKRIEYLTTNCNIVAEKIINLPSNMTETSSLLTRLLKNEVKFLYLTYSIFKQNTKLINILNIAKSRDILNRIVLIFSFNKIGKDNTGLNEEEKIIAKKNEAVIKSIINAMNLIPLLIITNKINYLNIDFLSIPLEKIILVKNGHQQILDDFQKEFKISSQDNKIPNNLFLEVMPKKSSLLTKNLDDVCNWLIKNHYLNGLNKNNENFIPQISSGIIFCLTNRDAESISAWLNKNGLPAAFFYSKMNKAQQNEVIINWETGGIKIVVIADAKNSQLIKKGESKEIADNNQNISIYEPFTLKNDVRFVIHYAIPKSISEYIEQISIAGKDGFISHSLLLFNEIDVKIIQRMIAMSSVSSFDENQNQSKQISQEDEFKDIVEYCQKDDYESNHNCRRTEIMKHYGIEFHYQNCYCMCDECEKLAANVEIKHDVTIHANNMLSIIKIMNSVEYKKSVFPTLNNVIDIYNGTRSIRKKKVGKNNGSDDTLINAPCEPEFKGEKKILLIKALKELCDREILKMVTKKVAHGNIKYFELINNRELIEDQILV